MSTIKKVGAVCLAVVIGSLTAHAQTWVGSWETADYSVNQPFPGAVVPDQTLREVIHLSAGGSLLRFIVSNQLGTNPLSIDHASIALRAAGQGVTSAINPNTLTPVTFSSQNSDGTMGHSASVNIAPGGAAISDPIAMNAEPVIPAASDVAISFHIAADNQPITAFGQGGAESTQYIVKGDHTMDVSLDNQTSLQKIGFYRFLGGVSVYADGSNQDPHVGSIVCFGDSITQGYLSTIDANHRYPDFLFDALETRSPPVSTLGVQNAGIAGDHVYSQGMYQPNAPTPPTAIDRFQRDALGRADVKYIILLEGINDLTSTCGTDSNCGPDLISNLKILIKKVRDHNAALPAGSIPIKIFGGTLTPDNNGTNAVEAARQMVNDWIRNSPTSTDVYKYDGVIDFDDAVRDPRYLPPMHEEYYPAYYNDGLHPNDAGYQRMGDRANNSGLFH